MPDSDLTTTIIVSAVPIDQRRSKRPPPPPVSWDDYFSDGPVIEAAHDGKEVPANADR